MFLSWLVCLLAIILSLFIQLVIIDWTAQPVLLGDVPIVDDDGRIGMATDTKRCGGLSPRCQPPI